jgi:hypothetical protein
MVCYRNMIYPSPNQHRPWMTLNIAQFWAETNLPTLYLEPFHPIPRFADAWLRIESHLHVSSDAQGQDCSEIVRTSLWQSQSWNYTQCLFSVTICISIYFYHFSIWVVSKFQEISPKHGPNGAQRYPSGPHSSRWEPCRGMICWSSCEGLVCHVFWEVLPPKDVTDCLSIFKHV